MEQNERLIWPDILKIVSILAVMIIHTSAPLMVQYDKLGEGQWWVGNLYNSASRWCVPVFVMLSGALLLGKVTSGSLGHFFRRRFQRVLVPFIVWSGIYFAWSIYGNHEEFTTADFFGQIFTEPIYYHLWFFYMIIGLYLLAPILGVFVENAGRSLTWYLVAIWFIFYSVLPMVEMLFEVETYFSTGVTNSTLKFVGYFMLGYLLKDSRFNAGQLLLFVLLFIVSFAVTAYGTYYLSVEQNGGEYATVFHEYFSINVLLMSVSIFVLGVNARIPDFISKMEERAKPIALVGGAVLGIYLVHAMLIEISKDGALGFEFDQMSIHPALGIPVFGLGVFLASLIIVLILKVIPLIKNIVP